MTFRNFTIIALSVLLAACAAAPQSLRQVASDNIETVDQILLITQSNLDITITQTNPGASGLIGALLVSAYDEYRLSNVKREATPIITALQDFDFRVIMLRAMAAAVGNSQRLAYPINTQLETIDSDSTRRVRYSDSSASVVLFTAVRYRLESGNLLISANLEAYPKIDALRRFRKDPNEENPLAAGNTIYRQTFDFKREGITPQNIQSSLIEGASSIATQIIADLEHPI
jgi:hypothetical protein